MNAGSVSGGSAVSWQQMYHRPTAEAMRRAGDAIVARNVEGTLPEPLERPVVVAQQGVRQGAAYAIRAGLRILEENVAGAGPTSTARRGAEMTVTGSAEDLLGKLIDAYA